MDTEQEKAAELAATQEVKEDEVRAKIVSDFGFDEANDAEKIDKLVKHEMDSHKKLSTAIGQKIKYRTDLEEARKNPPKPEVKTEELGTVVAKELDKRDLDALEYPDDLKKEIHRIANITGVSIKQAARDPYIVAKIGDYEKEKRAEDAAISKTNRSGGKKTYSFDSPPDVDLTTKEGREEWEAWKQAMIKAGN